jgi:predicted kinase
MIDTAKSIAEVLVQIKRYTIIKASSLKTEPHKHLATVCRTLVCFACSHVFLFRALLKFPCV